MHPTDPRTPTLPAVPPPFPPASACDSHLHTPAARCMQPSCHHYRAGRSGWLITTLFAPLHAHMPTSFDCTMAWCAVLLPPPPPARLRADVVVLLARVWDHSNSGWTFA